MNSIKCKKCGLSNFPTELECRRCRQSLYTPQKQKTKKPRRFSIWSLLMLTVVVGIVYYFYEGVQQSMRDLEADEAKRLAAQPKVLPNAQQPAGLSRSQAEQQRAGTYADAVKNSSSLNAHQQHVNDTEKAVQQISNSSAK